MPPMVDGDRNESKQPIRKQRRPNLSKGDS
jgi:hypothetical protein